MKTWCSSAPWKYLELYSEEYFCLSIVVYLKKCASCRLQNTFPSKFCKARLYLDCLYFARTYVSRMVQARLTHVNVDCKGWSALFFLSNTEGKSKQWTALTWFKLFCHLFSTRIQSLPFSNPSPRTSICYRKVDYFSLVFLILTFPAKPQEPRAYQLSKHPSPRLPIVLEN